MHKKYGTIGLIIALFIPAAAATVVSDSVRPHRRQPTRLAHPWDSPGKNTGVGCYFFLQRMKVKSEVAQLCLILRDPMDCSPPGSSIHGIFQARVLEWGAIAFSGCVGCEGPNLDHPDKSVCVCVRVCVCACDSE